MRALTFALLLVLTCLVGAAATSEAQDSNSNSNSQTSGAPVTNDPWEEQTEAGKTNRENKPSSGEAQVIAVFNARGNYDRPPDATPNRSKFVASGIGDSITVEVSDLKEALASNQVDPKDLVLYLGGYALKGVHPDQPVDLENGRLHFMILRTPDPDTRKALTVLLGGPTFGELFSFGHTLRQQVVTVGNGEKLTFGADPDKQDFNLIVIRQWRFLTSCLLFGLALAVFVLKAWKDTLIRDANPPLVPRLKKPFSLARVQMAWWFFLVVGSFVFIRLITGDINTITDQALVLIGIGTGTALGAAIIDINKKGELKAQLEELLPKQVAIASRIAELEALPNPTIQERQELAQKEVQLETIKDDLAEAQASLKQPQTEGFFTDLLTDANGYSFHRFQIAVWTIVLGLVFIVSVWRDLAMPEFSGTLLALMGISSGTYLGFKIPEKQVTAKDAENNNVSGNNG